jgi:hypothetical protein
MQPTITPFAGPSFPTDRISFRGCSIPWRPRPSISQTIPPPQTPVRIKTWFGERYSSILKPKRSTEPPCDQAPSVDSFEDKDHRLRCRSALITPLRRCGIHGRRFIIDGSLAPLAERGQLLPTRKPDALPRLRCGQRGAAPLPLTMATARLFRRVRTMIKQSERARLGHDFQRPAVLHGDGMCQGVTHHESGDRRLTPPSRSCRTSRSSLAMRAESSATANKAA